MDERLKELLQELGKAINESLSDSDRIAAAIGEIRRVGFDVFLVLEATIGFNKRDGDDDELGPDEDRLFSEEKLQFQSDGLRWTTQDEKFLKALKIAVEPDGKE